MAAWSRHIDLGIVGHGAVGYCGSKQYTRPIKPAILRWRVGNTKATPINHFHWEISDPRWHMVFSLTNVNKVLKTKGHTTHYFGLWGKKEEEENACKACGGNPQGHACDIFILKAAL